MANVMTLLNIYTMSNAVDKHYNYTYTWNIFWNSFPAYFRSISFQWDLESKPIYRETHLQTGTAVNNIWKFAYFPSTRVGVVWKRFY